MRAAVAHSAHARAVSGRALRVRSFTEGTRALTLGRRDASSLATSRIRSLRYPSACSVIAARRFLLRRGSPRAVFDTSLVAIRRARAAQIGSTSCPVARGIVRAVAPRDTSSSPAPRGVSGRAPRRNPAFRAAPQGCGDACVFGGWGARARASGASTRPEDTSSTTRDPFARRTRARTRRTRDFSRGARAIDCSVAAAFRSFARGLRGGPAHALRPRPFAHLPRHLQGPERLFQ